MPQKEHELFKISLAGVLIKDDKCLILEFTKRPGRWDIPGGRIDKGEKCDEAFRREIKEELGISEFEIISVLDYDIWHCEGKPLGAIAHLIKTDETKIKLSHEHSQSKWITEDEIDDYDFLWPKAPSMIKKAFEYNRNLTK